MKLLLPLLLLSGCAHDWTIADTGLTTAYVLTRAADWNQTRQIEDHPGLKETNGFLGEHPSDAEIDQYFALSTVGAVGLAFVLPKAWRRGMLFGLTGANVYAVINNDRLGLSVGGKF